MLLPNNIQFSYIIFRLYTNKAYSYRKNPQKLTVTHFSPTAVILILRYNMYEDERKREELGILGHQE